MALMFFYCRVALGMLVIAPAFKNFVTSKDLEEWFSNRILDGPDHYDTDASVKVGPTAP
jgi:hypothetical protein